MLQLRDRLGDGAPDARAGSLAEKSGSTRAEPVKFSAGTWLDGREALREMLMVCTTAGGLIADPVAALDSFVCAPTGSSSESDIAAATRIFIRIPLSVCNGHQTESNDVSWSLVSRAASWFVGWQR